MLFIGPPGVGKTHLAVALGHAAVETGHRVYYTTAADLAARTGAPSRLVVITIAAAMLDRLLHRCAVINITGDSYRLRAHQATNRQLTTTIQPPQGEEIR